MEELKASFYFESYGPRAVLIPLHEGPTKKSISLFFCDSLCVFKVHSYSFLFLIILVTYKGNVFYYSHSPCFK